MTNPYKTRCSCCSAHVSLTARDLPGNNDSEGNLCECCYGEHELQAWLEMHNMFDLIAKAIRSPISALKWQYSSDAAKWYHCQQLMRRGVIKWQIS